MDNLQTEAIKSALVILNKFAKEIGLCSRQANYFYFTDGSSKNRYFYTTKKIKHKGKLRYISGIYRYFKGEKCWKPGHLAGHAYKKKAIARAEKLAKRMNKKIIDLK